MTIKKIFGGGGGDDSKMGQYAEAAQSRLLDQQRSMLSFLETVGRTQYKRHAAIFNKWEAQQAKVGQQATKTAKRGVKPDYKGITNLGAQAAQDVGQQFTIARRGLRDDAARRGITMGDPTGVSTRASVDLAEAAAKAGAVTRADIEEGTMKRNERKYAEELTFNRRQQQGAAARGGAQTGVPTLSGVASGAGSAASGYGNMAGAAYDRAAAGADAGGEALSGIFQLSAKILPTVMSGGTVPPVPM